MPSGALAEAPGANSAPVTANEDAAPLTWRAAAQAFGGAPACRRGPAGWGARTPRGAAGARERAPAGGGAWAWGHGGDPGDAPSTGDPDSGACHHERVPTWREATLGGGARRALYESSDDDADGDWLPGAELGAGGAWRDEAEEDAAEAAAERAAKRLKARPAAAGAPRRRGPGEGGPPADVPRQGEPLARRLAELASATDQRHASQGCILHSPVFRVGLR